MRKLYWFDIALVAFILLFATVITLQVIHRVEHKRYPILMWDEGSDVVERESLKLQ